MQGKSKYRRKHRDRGTFGSNCDGTSVGSIYKFTNLDCPLKTLWRLQNAPADSMPGIELLLKEVVAETCLVVGWWCQGVLGGDLAPVRERRGPSAGAI